MKVVKWIVIVIAISVVAGFLALKIITHNTKKHSPNETVSFVHEDLTIVVNYCRPYKKGRQIFDSLVPYGVTWRTGANEPTTFSTTKDLKIAGKELKAGTYTLWTVPNPNTWEVIWNNKMYDWGVTMGGIATREPEHDVVNIEVSMNKLEYPLEQLTISFVQRNTLEMTIAWDRASVSVPISY